MPEEARAALLFEMELPAPSSDAECEAAVFRALEGAPSSDDPFSRLLGILGRHGVLERLELALPGATDRRQALRDFREAVPLRAGELLASRRREVPGLRKVGGDLIVPQSALGQMVRFYRETFERRGLQSAVWGHLSDGNLHPNALPRDEVELRSGVAALMEFAEEAIRLGGSPLSEHGVGRDPLKQELLRRFLGDDALEAMRRIKHGIDPPGRFAPGVLFPAT